jgi:hypothetical protein
MPGATAGSVGAKLQPPLDARQPFLDAINLASLLNVCDVQTRDVALPGPDAQVEVSKFLGQPIHLAIKSPQVLENEALRFFSHGAINPATPTIEA